MIRKKFWNSKAYFGALYAILQHQTVTPLVYSVDGTWDAITAFVVWIVAQSAAKVLNVVVVKNFHATRCLFLVSKIFWKYQTLEEMKCVKIHEMTMIVFRQPTRYQWLCRRNNNTRRTYAHRRFLWSNDSDWIIWKPYSTESSISLKSFVFMLNLQCSRLLDCHSGLYFVDWSLFYLVLSAYVAFFTTIEGILIKIIFRQTACLIVRRFAVQNIISICSTWFSPVSPLGFELLYYTFSKTA